MGDLGWEFYLLKRKPVLVPNGLSTWPLYQSQCSREKLAQLDVLSHGFRKGAGLISETKDEGVLLLAVGLYQHLNTG